MKKLLIIDGSSMLVSDFFGTLPPSVKFAKTDEEKELHYMDIMHTSTGIYTNAVYTMLKHILTIKEQQNPDYIAVCFDETRNTFRRELYPNYKANRKATMNPLAQQFGIMQKVLKELKIPVLSSTEYEADDLAGSLAKRFEKEIDVVLMTKDHDYYQLVSSRIHLWMLQTDEGKTMDLIAKYEDYEPLIDFSELPNRVVEFTPYMVKMETGVYPSQIPDLKGIVGDTSDNIPGVKGVSSAAPTLLAEYGSLEAIYEAINTVEKKELNEKWKLLGITRSPYNALVNDKDSAFLSKKLATIVTDIPGIEKYELRHLNFNIDNDGLKQVIEKYEFKSLKNFVKGN